MYEKKSTCHRKRSTSELWVGRVRELVLSVLFDILLLNWVCSIKFCDLEISIKILSIYLYMCAFERFF